jgi:hypothetical protein
MSISKQLSEKFSIQIGLKQGDDFRHESTEREWAYLLVIYAEIANLLEGNTDTIKKNTVT